MSTDRLPCGCIMSTSPLGVMTYQPCSPGCSNYSYVQEQIRQRDIPTKMQVNPGCWACGAVNDQFMGVGDTDPGVPDEGAISICGSCAAVAVYTGQALLTRKPTTAELAGVMAEPVIVKAIAAIQHLRGTA